jgi:2-polyprenyl-3-methyl-5-hydroxy-6-metoxy-1,4-benzoquinol methylase
MESGNPLRLDDIRSDDYKEMQITAYENDLKRLHTRLQEFVHVSCPACERDDATFKFEKYRCSFVECKSCHTIYMSPRPTPEVMDDYYSKSENYAIWNKYIFPKSEDGRREKICRPNLEKIISECKAHNLADPHLIEVGPGFGTFSALAQASGFFSQVTVVERNPEMVNACLAKNLKVISSSLEDMSDEDIQKAEVVVCFEVMEHIFSPIEFVRVITRLLKPGGLFIFTCPNGKGFDTMMLEVAAPAVDTEHVNLFNTSSIAVMLKAAGLSTLSVETPGRLDVELVRRGVLAGDLDLSGQEFLRQVIIDNYQVLGGVFQRFLTDNNLSGNMRVVAKLT